MKEMLLAINKVNAGFLHRLTDDIPAAKFCFQPVNLPNHPAWQVGHLTMVRSGAARMLGRPTDISDQWIEPFKRGSTPVADPSQYPTKEELLATFDRAQAHLAGVLQETDFATLDRPHSLEFMLKAHPTLRQLLTNMLTTHDGLHFGQLSDWRRANGLPRVI